MPPGGYLQWEIILYIDKGVFNRNCRPSSYWCWVRQGKGGKRKRPSSGKLAGPMLFFDGPGSIGEIRRMYVRT